MDVYKQTALACSRIVTQNYSTSFSLGIRCFKKKYRAPIYALYGFVRIADEIVDTFHSYNKEQLLKKYKDDTRDAIRNGISTNPILHSFQQVTNQYNIQPELIDAFLRSMEMDLHHHKYDGKEIEDYIYGSAEVVGLMCLKIFCNNNIDEYNSLEIPARKLGEAFQKVNFLRDLKADYEQMGRVYFPGVDFSNFTESEKKKIETDIHLCFNQALQGIRLMNKEVQLGVFLAHTYYLALLKKIEVTMLYIVVIKFIDLCIKNS